MKSQEAVFSVRTTIIIIVLLSSVILSLLVYFIANAILLESYLTIERQETEAGIARVNDIIHNQQSQLERLLFDWSSWDDTYVFIQDQNEAYIRSNLVDSTLENFGLDAIIFVDSQDNIVLAKTLGTGNRAEQATQNMVEHIKTNKVLTTHADLDNVTSGIVSLPEGPLMLASAPIVTSEVQGPIMGSLIFAYYLTDERINEIANLARLSADVYPYSSESLPEDVQLARQHLEITGGYYVQPLSEEVVAGYTVYHDVYGNPLFLLRVDADRPVYAQGRYIFRAFTLALGLSTAFFGLMIIYLLERFIIRRLALLDDQVAKITETKDLTLRVDNGRSDEIGKLANSVNRMIGELASLQEQERSAKEEAAVANTKLTESLDEMQKVNRLMVGRELKMIDLKKELARVQKRSGLV